MQTVADPAANLWLRAQSMWWRATDVTGEPAALAARTGLTRHAKHKIGGWLARLESIVRKLLLTMAVTLLQNQKPASPAKTATPQARAASKAACAKAARPSQQAPHALDRAAPDTWRVRFKLAPPRILLARLQNPAPRTGAPRRLADAGLRFALRLEALKRVLADPAPHARRLARIFSRLAPRYPDAAHRYAIAPARPYARDEGDPRLIIDVMGPAMNSAYLLDTS